MYFKVKYCYDKYTIKNGETLNDIAIRFNTLKETIMDINNIPFEDMIREGFEIIVPKEKENYFDYYTIKNGDSIYKIAREYNVNPSLLMILNGLEKDDYIYPEQVILIPKSGYSYYITKEGDTLDIVSNKFKVNKNEILNNNRIIYLLPGQLLINKNQ